MGVVPVRGILLAFVSLLGLVGTVPAAQQPRVVSKPLTGQVRSVDTRDRSFVVTMPGPRGRPVDVIVRYEAKTRFVKDREPGAAADLKPGLAVTVEGRGSPERGVYAEQVTLYPRGVGRARSTMGTVKSVDAESGTFVLTATLKNRQQVEVAIKVDEKTRFRAGRDDASFPDLAPGRNVLVQGEGDPVQSLTAHQVFLLPATLPGQPRPRGR
jgi:hypothetical protein